MSNPPSSLSKICSVCGQLKPMGAFSQLTSMGTQYGNICDTCRKGAPSSLTDDETKSTTGAVIDTKSKVQSDTDKAQEFKKTEEDYHKERDEKEEVNVLEEEKKEGTVKQEIKHRQSFIEKQRFISTPKKDTGIQATSRWAQDKVNQQTHNKEHTLTQEASGKEEKQKTEIDLTAPMEDTRIAGKVKYSGDAFKRFTASIKHSSPFARTFDATNKGASPTQEKPSEFVEKNWGPKTRK